MPGVHQILPVVFALVAAVFFIAGTATCDGMKGSVGGYTLYDNNWKTCGGNTQTTYPTDCSSWQSYGYGSKAQCNEQIAIRAFEVLACIFAVLALVFLIVQYFQKAGQRHIATTLFFCAFVTGLIAMAIWADYYNQYANTSVVKLDAGFACITIGWIISLVAAIHFHFGPKA